MKARNAETEVHKIVEKLKEIRVEKGVSHEKLAAKIGLSRTTIGMIESNKNAPTLKTVMRICTGLEIKLSDVLKKMGH